ncbi:MnhB domain-containing protein [Olivibacter sitiensis]|uniref:MnhB domain-containing protein n=1 Tax=Olivibacter sitiensis TaxID=376470 RepID=UPI000484A2AF|nr:MnhB domain-containing protein [Olivibacter sitiensis]
MRTIVLQTAIRVLLPIFFVYSLYLLFRGHDSPGGGFIGALVVSIALIFHVIAFGVTYTIEKYRINTMWLTASGLLLVFFGGVGPMLLDDGFFHAMWSNVKIPFIGTLSSVLLFDIGVYLGVVGSIMKISLTILEED